MTAGKRTKFPFINAEIFDIIEMIGEWFVPGNAMITGMFLLRVGNMYPRLSLSTSEPAPTNPTAVARKRYRAHNRMRMGFFFSE